MGSHGPGRVLSFHPGNVSLSAPDCWMLLPSVVALRLRDRQLQLFANSAGGATLFRQALLEGLCWGTAFWIKPFVAVPALACWVVSVLARRRNRSGVWFDAAGLIAGGLIAGSLGLAWLAFTGSWHSFWEILLVWNREYASYVYFRMSRSDEIYYWLEYSLPWALVLVLTTATALTAIHHAVRGHGNASHKTASRALLGAFSLGYLVQAVFIQFPPFLCPGGGRFPGGRVCRRSMPQAIPSMPKENRSAGVPGTRVVYHAWSHTKSSHAVASMLVRRRHARTLGSVDPGGICHRLARPRTGRDFPEGRGVAGWGIDLPERLHSSASPHAESRTLYTL